MNPFLTICVPVYNMESYLGECLESIRNQTFDDFEVVVIDDGSKDSSPEICDSYSMKDERFRVIHKANAGVGSARNLGIEEARGKWLAFIDPDDWYEPDYFEKMVAEIQEDSNVIIAGGYFEEYARKTVIKNGDGYYVANKEEIVNKLLPRILAGPNTPQRPKYVEATIAAPWDKLYRTDFLVKTGVRFSTKYHPCEDVLFNFQVYSKANKVSGTNAVGYHYRIIGSSSMRGFNPRMPLMVEIFMTDLEEYISSLDIDDLQRKHLSDAFMARCIISFIWACRCYYYHEQNTLETCDKRNRVLVFMNMLQTKMKGKVIGNSYLSAKYLFLGIVIRLKSIHLLDFAFSIFK